MKRTEHGFTLIELLIALGVMAVFSLMAYRGLDSVMRLHSGAYAHEQQAQAIDRTITQLEADLRQASQVRVLAGLKEEAGIRLQIHRRIESGLSSEMAKVEWVLEAGVLQRRTTLASGVQIAALLSSTRDLSWLTFNAAPSNAAMKVDWRAISVAELLAQTTQSIEMTRGIGVRLTVAGKPLEKLFLLGR